jgi:predicted dehydrogenase
MLYFRADGDPSSSGYVRIESGPEHHPYGFFCVAGGHQLGFNDLKTIEVADFLEGIAGGENRGPDFREAWEIQKIADTALESARTRKWQPVE